MEAPGEAHFKISQDYTDCRKKNETIYHHREIHAKLNGEIIRVIN